MRVGGMFKRQGRPRTWIVMGVAILSLALVPWMGSRTTAQAPTRPGVESGRYLFSDLAERVIPSVVTVYVKRDMRNEMKPQDLDRLKQFQRQFQDDPLLRQLIPFGIPDPDDSQQGGDDSEQWITKGSGSGVIVSSDGYILTNWHVVGEKKNKPEIRVVLSDNTELSGKDVQLVESSKLADLAVLKIDRTGLKAIQWGDSDKLRIGEWVAAIGSPLDLRLTVTQGIICAVHREIDSGTAGMGSMLQTDAVINPGSSGGALVNLDGQLVGINRLITTPFQGREAWSGYGFAIPSNDAKQFVDTVMKQGRMTYGYIGVGVANEFQDNEKLRGALGLRKDQKGALVWDVNPGTPAYEAGLQQGDFIIAADGKPITNYNDLVSTVARRPIGSNMKLTVLRPQQEEGAKPKEIALTIKIAVRPSQEELDSILNGTVVPKKPAPTPDARPENSLGVTVEPYSQNGQNGLKITAVKPNSPAARGGLQPGDVLININYQALRTNDDMAKALKARHDQPHLIRYLRNGVIGMTYIEQDGKK